MNAAPALQTQPPSDGFIFIEQPTVSARCPKCGAFTKTGLSPTEVPIFLSIPYQVRSIENFASGRSYEKVAAYFRHQCQQSAAA